MGAAGRAAGTLRARLVAPAHGPHTTQRLRFAKVTGKEFAMTLEFIDRIMMRRSTARKQR
jgi:hypothetical protein